MIEKAESKDNLPIHCHVAAIAGSRYNKDSKVKAYWDLYEDYRTQGVRIVQLRSELSLKLLTRD